MFFCEAGNRSIDSGVQRIRIILWSIKLRVLNPKLHKQALHQRDKKKRHIKTKHANIIENVCFFSRASGRFATQKGTKAFIVVSVGFGRLLRRGCPVDDDGILLLSCLLFAFIIIIIIIICRRLRAGSREIISFLVFEILSVCRRRAFDDATMRRQTLFGRRF